MSNTPNVEIRTNAVSGPVLEHTFEKTVDHIYETIRSVYGPYGKSVFHNINGREFTKDGKNIFMSYDTDNDVAGMIKGLMLEAINTQEQNAGDGTTTVSLLYCVLTKQLREYFRTRPVSEPHFRRAYAEVTEQLIKEMKKFSREIEEDSNDMVRLIYTATQDKKLTADIYEVVKEAKGDTTVNLSFNTFSDQNQIEYHDRAQIESSPLTVIGKSIPKGYETKAIILYVHGMLTIRDRQTLQYLRFIADVMSKDIIILCSGTTKDTKDTIIEYYKDLQDQKVEVNNRIFIQNITAYHNYMPSEREDLTELLYDTRDAGSLTEAIIFERNLLYSMRQYFMNLAATSVSEEDKNLFGSMGENIDIFLQDRYQLDIPMDVTKAIEFAFTSTQFRVAITNEELSIEFEPTENVQSTIDDLQKVIKSVGSNSQKMLAKKRLHRINGKYIDVEIGARLSKDTVRQADAWQDAITSAQNAINGGIIDGNATLLAVSCLMEMKNTMAIPATNATEKHFKLLKNDIIDMLLKSITRIVLDLVSSCYTIETRDISADIIDNGMETIYKHFHEASVESKNIFKYSQIPVMNLNLIHVVQAERGEDTGSDLKLIDTMDRLIYLSTSKNSIDIEYITMNDGEAVRINTTPLETFDVFRYILENSTTALDIALSPIFIIPAYYGKKL